MNDKEEFFLNDLAESYSEYDLCSDDKIIELSGINESINLFKLNENQVINNIKNNAYIENVNVSRKLPNKVVLDVIERTAKYQLQFADSYVYINNQGYMLEISNEKQKTIKTEYLYSLKSLFLKNDFSQ